MTETPGSDGQPETTPGDQPPPPSLPPVYGSPPPPGYGQPPPVYGSPPPGYGPLPAAQWGMTGNPSAPFGHDPLSGLPYSDKSRTAAGLLQLLLPCVSVCGVGRLITGHLAIGLIQLIGYWVGVLLIVSLILLPFGILVVLGLWIWSVVDGILILSGNVKDSRGLPLRP